MMTRGRSTVIALVVSASMLAPARAVASTFRTLDLGELAGQSESIVRAVVLDQVSAWNREGSMIFTDVTLAVKQALRGSPPERITIRVPGGTVDGFTTVMLGSARFETGTEVVVFTGRWKDGVPRVAGYEQGVSRVRRDAAGNAVLEGGVAHGLGVGELAERLAAIPSRVKQ